MDSQTRITLIVSVTLVLILALSVFEATKPVPVVTLPAPQASSTPMATTTTTHFVSDVYQISAQRIDSQGEHYEYTYYTDDLQSAIAQAKEYGATIIKNVRTGTSSVIQ